MANHAVWYKFNISPRCNALTSAISMSSVLCTYRTYSYIIQNSDYMLLEHKSKLSLIHKSNVPWNVKQDKSSIHLAQMYRQDFPHSAH